MTLKKLISLLIVVLFLVGCQSNVEDEDKELVIVNSDSSSYNYVKPLETTYIRFEHSGKSGKDYMEIGKGLTEISKEYFSPSDYDIKEGTILTDYKNDYQPLILLRESKDNPFGLNPMRDTKVAVNKNTEVTGPIFVSDIYEVNFVSKKDHSELAGAAFSLVLNKTVVGDDGQQVVVDDDVLYNFATEIAGPKLESYLRKKPELSNVPILITMYVTDSSNESIPGNYIAKAMYENRQGQFSKVNHYWLIFSTESGRLLDGFIDEQIAGMKRSVNAWLPEDVGIVGYGEYKDEQLHQLKISVNVQSKTYTEVEALSQHLGELIVGFDTSAPIRVELKSMDRTLAIIVKNSNSSKVEVIMM